MSNENDLSSGQSLWRVWRSLLDESNNLALSRLRSAETQQRLSKELKPLKLQRLAVNKRVFEQLRILQSDLAACVQEMVKSHKVYAEEEKQAQDTRLKAMAAEEKIRRRSTDIFHSMAQLHRNYEKLVIRRQAYDARSASARNEYLFQLTAINAHLKHYFSKDVPNLVKAGVYTLDGELYEKLSDVLSTLGQNEAELCALTRERFQHVFKDATQITRTYAWEHFLKSCPLFDRTVQYQFEPMEGDETTLLRAPDSKEASLEQIARKLARRLVIRERRIKSYETELKTLQAGCMTPYQNAQPLPGSPDFENNEELVSFNQEYVEHKVEEVQFAIRREVIERVKIEACLSLLRNSAVEVKQFVEEARLAAEAASAAALAQQLREANGELLDDSQTATSLCNRPTDGSSDSVSSSAGRLSELQTGYNRAYGPHTGPRYISQHRSQTNVFEYTEQKYDVWSSTAVGQTYNPAESKSNTVRLRSNVEPNRLPPWSSLGRHPSHDYQNVDPARRTKDDLSMDQRHLTSGRLGSVTVRETNSDNTISDDAVDLEAIWSEHGRLHQATVLHEFRAKRPNELDLVVHETVALLESNDKNGWIKVRSLIDGNEGLVPVDFLRMHTPNHAFKLPNSEEQSASSDGAPSGREFCKNMSSEVCTNNGESYKNDTGLYENVKFSERKRQDSNKVLSGQSEGKGMRRKHDKARTQSLPPPLEETHKTMRISLLSLSQDDSPGVDEKSQKHSPVPGTFCRTLIEFEGNNKDELRFSAGEVIRILGRAPVPTVDNPNDCSPSWTTAPTNRMSSSFCSGVDDGWWEGELLSQDQSGYTRIKGVFPSMLVQSMSSEDGKPWHSVWQHAAVVKRESQTDECGKRPTTCSVGKTTTPSTPLHNIESDKTTAPTNNIPKVDDQNACGQCDLGSEVTSDGDYIQWTMTSLPAAGNIAHGHVPFELAQVMLQHSLRNPSEEELQIAEL
ncbi:SH3 domain protein [Paragonimus heterotremus]|uniref:SH3 domain protein n=1 Tax=Paragonimus heterotremus TaxID=100268 RepID=A0A8J4WGZ8_9TREM|nr:SH3 domain protein [Paragonimus heterotremus]